MKYYSDTPSTSGASEHPAAYSLSPIPFIGICRRPDSNNSEITAPGGGEAAEISYGGSLITRGGSASIPEHETPIPSAPIAGIEASVDGAGPDDEFPIQEDDDPLDQKNEFDPYVDGLDDGIVNTEVASELALTEVHEDLPSDKTEPLRADPVQELRPDASDRLQKQAFGELRREGEASFTVENWKAELDRQREVDELLERVDQLIARVAELPMSSDRDGLVRRLEKLSRSDVQRCLRLIGETLEEQTPVHAQVVVACDPAEWVALLERSIREVEELGAPTIVVVPPPDGRIDGRMPRRVYDVEVLKSRGVMFGANATMTVLHRCKVEQPVIEIAALIDSVDTGVAWQAWRCEASTGLGVGRAADGIQPRIVDCKAVSIGANNTQHNLFEHRMSGCPVNLGVLLADDDIREELVRCRDESLEDAERVQARERLRRVVTRVVRLTDASSLIPDEAITRYASQAQARPDVRSRGAALTVMHGMGVAIGWEPTVGSRTTTEVGRFQIR